METVHHTVIVETEDRFGDRIPPALCGELLKQVDRELRLAVSMAFRGASRVIGRKPSWLVAASDVRFVDLEGRDETVLHFEAPKFGAAAPELYEQGELWPTRPRPELTGFEVFSDVMRDVANEDAESDRYDRPLLEGIAGFGRLAKQGVRAARFEDARRSQSEFSRLDLRVAESAGRLAARAPAVRRVKLAGRLDMLRVSTETFLVQLDTGDEVRGVYAGGDFGRLRGLLRERVLIDGRAVFRPSGRLLRVDADSIESGEGAGEFFSRLPRPGAAETSASRFRKPQSSTTGANAIFGRWPGDETEEELVAALEELS
jgi:hypothetical protein